MSRTARVLWPVGALLVSFLLMWVATRSFFSTEKLTECKQPAPDSSPYTIQPAPPWTAGQGAVMTVTGVVVPGSDKSAKRCVLVPDLLVLEEGSRLCLASKLTDGDWRLVDDLGNQRKCLGVTPGQTLTVRVEHS